MAGNAGRDVQHWNGVAQAWIQWARTPGHDVFWAYRAALAAYIGQGRGQALEVGCGEGRVSRLLASLGYEVTAAEPVPRLLEAARQAESAQRYVACEASRLPFADGSFDLVVAYNVLMDIEDMPAALAEMRRVMRPAATLVVSIVHPLADAGRYDGDAPDAPFIVTQPYFGRKPFEGSESRNGLTMSFFGWTQPLHAYADALEAAGLAITSLREPVPEASPAASGLERWKRLPLFLWLKAQRLPPA
ncbi:class I SAM-dependent methyltransferase [Orrella sp. JC864]|uniref:class I SAM-dependent methyltransferase n=1 Tax=Orrella sp. JC864 TaxID=3120298 RepID=UPI00300A954E